MLYMIVLLLLYDILLSGCPVGSSIAVCAGIAAAIGASSRLRLVYDHTVVPQYFEVFYLWCLFGQAHGIVRALYEYCMIRVLYCVVDIDHSLWQNESEELRVVSGTTIILLYGCGETNRNSGKWKYTTIPSVARHKNHKKDQRKVSSTRINVTRAVVTVMLNRVGSIGAGTEHHYKVRSYHTLVLQSYDTRTSILTPQQ